MSIRTRLLLLVLALWLPAVASLGLQAHSIYLQEVHSAQQQIQRLADSLNSAVERELEKGAVMAMMLAASSAIRDGDLRRFHEEATAAVRDSDAWVYLVDRTRQLANTLRPYDVAAPVPRVPSAPFVTGKPQVFFSPRGPVMQGPVLGIFAPEAIVSPPRYNVGVSRPLSSLQSVIAGLSFPEGSVAAVIDRDQIILARSRDPDRWVGRQATGPLKARAQAGETGFAPSVTLDGVASLTYLSKPNRFDCSVVIALPQSALSAAAWRLTLQAFTASATLLGIGLALALYAARRISKPVLALRRCALQLGQEQLPPKLGSGVLEVDEVSAALHEVGVRVQEAARTLEHRVAQAVQQAQEAQSRLLSAQKHEAIGRLTGGIAHDFNNLLQTISTAHQVLDRFVTQGQQRRVLDGAMRATSKAADLIRQMLAFGRTQPLQAQPVSLSDFMLKTQELTGKAMGERIKLSASIAPDLPALLVDPTQLELALLNLVFNARDAMPGGGTVRVEGRLAKPEETAGLAKGRYICLEVSDNGPGMHAGTLARAFDPYFTTKPLGAGSGIGLSQVLAFARQSGGDAWLQSAVGAGTRASLLLPVCDAAVSAGQQTEPNRPVLRELHILMVEDDLLVASVVKSALEGLGHRVTLCRTADDAMPVLAGEQPFDVLFTDVVMPGTMTGIDLVEWCGVHRPGLPCVIASGYTAQQLSRPVQVLHKPYAIGELASALEQAVGMDAGRSRTSTA